MSGSVSEHAADPRDVIRERARALRKRPTGAEAVLRSLLRDAGERRIRRQFAVGSVIVDLAIPRRNLLIEVDGGYHAAQRDRDEHRDAWLRGLGFNVLRLRNEEVLVQGVTVVARVHSFAESDDAQGRFRLATRTGRASSYALRHAAE